MNVEAYRDYCLTKPGVTEGFPFSESALVFKVMNKMFALVDIDIFEYTNLKCDPERALELRDQYESVRPGYHMSKKHWNSVYFDSDASDQQIFEWVDHSYDLVVSSLPKNDKEALQKLS
jgi:predicted DNA-binding protein (MmcQ/YjbR family)